MSPRISLSHTTQAQVTASILMPSNRRNTGSCDPIKLSFTLKATQSGIQADKQDDCIEQY